MAHTPSHFPIGQSLSDQSYILAADTVSGSPHSGEANELAPSRSATSINASRKVLVVENDESLQRMFKVRLEHEGYAVRTACDAEEGLRLYQDCAPFVVVLIDHSLPKDGVMVANSIRQQNPSQKIVIAAFAYQTEEQVPRPQELMDIPLLIDISQLRTLFGRIRHWATRDDVDRAIAMLTSIELLKLQKFAEYRVRGLGRAGRGRTGEDLLQDVLLRTLQGAESTKGRHWNKGVDFFNYLVWAIRSTSDNWKKRHMYDLDVYLTSEVITSKAAEEKLHPMDSVASEEIAQDQCLIAREEEGRILELFNKDSEAKRVLHELVAGMKKLEIMQRHGITETQYRKVVKRIRVKLLGGKKGTNGDQQHGG